MYYLIPYAAMSFGSFAVSPRASASSARRVTLDNLARLRLGAAVPRHRDVVLHVRLRRPAARRAASSGSSTSSRRRTDHGWSWL